MNILRSYIRYAVYLFVLYGLNIANAGSYEDFFRAIRRDDGNFIGQLMQRGFDANSLDPEGRTGLSIALREEYAKVYGVLVDWPKTDINLSNREGETPLMLAALIGDLAIMEKMIKRGADVNKTGWTPLHYAASKGQVPAIRLLLENSAYIDAESPNGTTPLMMAAMYGSPESVKVLVEEGADTTLKNKQGMTALGFAKEGSRPDAIRMLSGTVRKTQAAPAPPPAPAVPAAAPRPAPASGPRPPIRRGAPIEIEPEVPVPARPAPSVQPAVSPGAAMPTPAPAPAPRQAGQW